MSINECVLNTLNVELTRKESEALEKFKYLLRKLLKRKSIKLKILLQEGGFLQVLLPSAISLIGTLLEYFVNRRNERIKKVDGENFLKVVHSKLDTIIKDENLKDDDF